LIGNVLTFALFSAYLFFFLASELYFFLVCRLYLVNLSFRRLFERTKRNWERNETLPPTDFVNFLVIDHRQSRWLEMGTAQSG